jgi:hypothetical protein
MADLVGLGKTFLSWALALLASMALSGCLDNSSDATSATPATPTSATDSDVTNAPPLNPLVNNPPEISGVPPVAGKAGQPYTFTPAAEDVDQDFLEFAITNKPSWAQFSVENGTLVGTPADADVGDSADITITVTDGHETRAVGPFRVRIHARNQTPSANNQPPAIDGSPGHAVDVGQTYTFQPSANDADGDPLTFSISNRPAWASFSTATGRLSGTPTASNVATYARILISASDGHVSTALPMFSLQVRGADNSAPRISGTPGSSVQATQTYAFQPSASDPDNDTLTYSVQNLPAWAAFSASTGRLSGMPNNTQAGSYTNIVIAVSDGRLTAKLAAFAINVQAVANHAPTIAGAPPRSVNANAAYSFTPTAKDVDGDTLGFTIQNRPSWASFDTATGRLSGKPTVAQLGISANIVITVSDSRASAALAAFTLTVNATNSTPPPGPVAEPASGGVALFWDAPTDNVDGSVLTSLAGYRIVYGTNPAALTQTTQIANPGATSYVVEDLAAGTWYFAVQAYTNSGAESELSNLASRVVH